MFLDTPLPPEEPAGENPPDGAMIDYYLRTSVSEVTLQVLDGDRIVRTYTSSDVAEVVDPTSFRHPTYWIRSAQRLATEPGLHRFIWDYVGLDALSAERRHEWIRLRGEGEPSQPDFLYSSVYQSSLEDETLVGLQEKFLYLLNIFQQADARPTTQAIDAVDELQKRLQDMKARWEEAR